MARTRSILRSGMSPMTLCLVVLLALTRHSIIAQKPEGRPFLQADGDFTYQFGWSSSSFRGSFGLRLGHSRVFAQVGWDRAGRQERLYGIGYQFYWNKAEATWFEPNARVLAYRNDNKNPPDLFGPRITTHGLDFALGLRFNLPYGAYLFAHAGFCMERLNVYGGWSVLANRTWVKPSSGLGFGWCLGLRPWKGLRQRPAALPMAQDSFSRHAVHLQFSHASFFFYQPSIDYRFQYEYAILPRIHAFAGVDGFTSRWFWPSRPARDTFGLGTFRLGGRFFPFGAGHRFKPYAEASGAIGHRLPQGYTLVPQTFKQFQLEWGMGLRMRLAGNLNSNILFFRRSYWLYPPRHFRQWEFGFAFGLGYHFGKPKH